MKTRHIIAIGLLSALAVGILGLAIHTGKAKAKTLQTKADYETFQYSYPNSTNEYHQMNLVIENTKSIEFEDPYIFYEIKNTFTYNTYNNQSSIGRTTEISAIETDNENYDNFTTAYVYNFETEIKLIDIQIVHNSTTFNQNQLTIDQSVWITYKDNNGQHSQNIGTPIQNTYANANENISHTEYIQEDYIELSNTIEDLYNLYTTTYNEGYQEGLTETSASAYQTGYNAGYGIGYNDSEAFNHPIALQPLMLNILTMPFTFISQAFDVTLWPGTQYEFNIANFIKGMIAIATIMFIIKLFTSGFSIIGNYTSNIRNESNMRSAQRQKNRASKMHKQSKEKKE